MQNTKLSSYNLITPVKNEEEHLPKLAHCVVNQSHPPEVWVIIDDGSTDRTREIIKGLTSEHRWIHTIQSEQSGERTFGSHFAEIVRTALDKSVELSGDVKYLIKVDADVRFHDDTFKMLVETMDNDANLAIASPRLMTLRQEIDVAELRRPEAVLENKDLIIRTDRKRINEPTDGIRIYRKRFLDEIGGFPITAASDDIVLGKAVMKGYSIGFVDRLWGSLTRDTGTTLKSNYMRGKFKGHRLYVSYYHPLMVAGIFVWDALFNSSRVVGEVAGYFESVIKRRERIDDPDVKRYYGRERFKKLLTFMKRRFAG